MAKIGEGASGIGAASNIWIAPVGLFCLCALEIVCATQDDTLVRANTSRHELKGAGMGLASHPYVMLLLLDRATLMPLLVLELAQLVPIPHVILNALTLLACLGMYRVLPPSRFGMLLRDSATPTHC